MAEGGSESARELDQTPTWAVALVSAVIIIISIVLEKTLHKFGETFERRKKKALFDALEKIKGELMVLGFISLILTFGQNYISKICIPEEIGYTMLPCPNRSSGEEKPKNAHGGEAEHHRRLLWYEHRMLAGDSPARGCKKGYVPLMSINGIHQLHIFIFFLAVFHVIYSAITMMLGRLKIRGWKEWERENVDEYDDPSRFRLTRETSFVRDHTSFWTRNPILFYTNAFEITNFIWISYEFGMHSCFHDNFYLAIFRVVLGLGVQFLCSYITLPLYALVTQMGSNMKKSIFDEQTSKALMNWHKHAKKKKDEHSQPRTKKLGGSPGDSPDNSPLVTEASRGTADTTASVDIPVENLVPD
ncbi:MLO-like protein 8 [Forsythia ovata]|uniref:MLO-like protein 8 n=1 Tax=Forsythia ovata TaxID=205694 RepID=A0ABD1UXI1_9LAMI